MNDFDEEYGMIRCWNCEMLEFKSARKCFHCGAPLVTHHHRVMNHIMALVAVLSMVALAIGMLR